MYVRATSLTGVLPSAGQKGKEHANSIICICVCACACARVHVIHSRYEHRTLPHTHNDWLHDKVKLCGRGVG